MRLTPILPGVWKVYRVLAGFKEDEWSPGAPLKSSKRVLVFCHRLVNDSWKRSFSHNCCEVSLVRPISMEDHKRVQAALSDDDLRKAFEQYGKEKNRIDLIANLGFGGLSKKAAGNFAKLSHKMFADRIGQGMTMREILLVLQEHGLVENQGEIPRQVTLQFTCINHELRGDEFVHREFRTLPF